MNFLWSNSMEQRNFIPNCYTSAIKKKKITSSDVRICTLHHWEATELFFFLKTNKKLKSVCVAGSEKIGW